MEIKAVHNRPVRDRWFTGAVRVDPLFQAPEPARVTGDHLRARCSHSVATHPLGQTLVCDARVDRSKKYGPVMSSGFRPVRNTGMEPLRQRPCHISPFRNC